MHEDLVKDLIEQHSFEAWTQPGSSLRQPPASRYNLLPMDSAPSAKPDKVVVSKPLTSFMVETATEAEIQEGVTPESWKKNVAVIPAF